MEVPKIGFVSVPVYLPFTERSDTKHGLFYMPQFMPAGCCTIGPTGRTSPALRARKPKLLVRNHRRASSPCAAARPYENSREELEVLAGVLARRSGIRSTVARRLWPQLKAEVVCWGPAAELDRFGLLSAKFDQP